MSAMIHKKAFALLACIIVTQLLGGSAAPQAVEAKEIVVLVHGLAGYGPNELLGGYWGFGGKWRKFIQQETGLPTYEAVVGPFSSLHDRACELYAQIKGLQTDFGEKHSDDVSHTHNRYGRDFTGNSDFGWLPNWADAGSNDVIHFVGHSMGGQTIRVLERYIQEGLQEEVTRSGGGVSNLFRTDIDRSNAIKSFSAIASPLDGSTLHSRLGGFLVDSIKSLVVALSAVLDGDLFSTTNDGGGRLIYDMKLDHMGLSWQPGETFGDYWDRVSDDPVWDPDFKDFAHHDLSPGAMRTFNKAGPRGYSNTYYFAMSTRHTDFCPLAPWNQCGKITMLPPLAITAGLMGNMRGGRVCDNDKTNYCFDNSWEPNDGVVSAISSRGPAHGNSGPGRREHPHQDPSWWNVFSSRKYFYNNLQKNQWYWREFDLDHLQVVGIHLLGIGSSEAQNTYDHLVKCINTAKNN